jgi:hypothetical protein
MCPLSMYDNNATPMFIGLNKTTQKHGRCKRERAREKIKSYVLKQMYFNMKDKNAIALVYCKN